MNAFWHEFGLAARQGPRIYFAPLVGAVRAIRNEMKRLASPVAAGARPDRKSR
jgi:hypothetical protein